MNRELKNVISFLLGLLLAVVLVFLIGCTKVVNTKPEMTMNQKVECAGAWVNGDSDDLDSFRCPSF